MGKPSKVTNPQAAWGDKELRKHVRSHGAYIKQSSGSHFGIFLKGKRVATAYPAKTYPKGTRASIVKMLKAAGMLLFLVVPPILGGVVAYLM